MIIRSKAREFAFSIEGYEFPNQKPQDKNFDHDVNWLMVSIKYTDKDTSSVYKDPCLLTYELEDTAEKICEVLSGESELFISNYLEPNLKIAFMKAENSFVLGVEFAYTTDGRIKHALSKTLSEDEAKLLVKELQAAVLRFPAR